MISLPRGAVAACVALMRRVVARSTPPPVLVRSGPGGCALTFTAGETAVRLDVPGAGPDLSVVLNGAALAVIGGDDGEVTLQPGEREVHIAWVERGVPLTRQAPILAPDLAPPFPSMPAEWAPLGDNFLSAVATAVPLAAKESSRYALHRLALDGRNRQLVATDSKLLFLQGPWPFPWGDLVLVPASPVLTAKELRCNPVGVGRTETHVFIRAGPWTIALARDLEGRYPAYADVPPKPQQLRTQVHFTDGDVDLLLKQLPRLPVTDADTPAVTLTTGSPVRIAAEGATLPLPTARASGPTQTLNCDRRHWLKALRLGFTHLGVVNPSRPAVFLAPGRQFVFMPLSPPEVTAPTEPPPETCPMAAATITATPATNGVVADPLTDAEEVRNLLREADTRMTRLVAHLKHHRRQTRALRSAMDSLRALPELAAPTEK